MHEKTFSFFGYAKNAQHFCAEKLNQKKGKWLKQKRNDIEKYYEKAGVRKDTQVSPFLFGNELEKRKALKRKRKTKRKEKNPLKERALRFRKSRKLLPTAPHIFIFSS